MQPLLYLPAVTASLIALFLIKSRINYLRLPKLPRREGSPGDVTVVIPARNEERNIERVAKSFHSVRVLVVDDGSTDRTAELAMAAGARVIQAPPLNGDALGKPNACLAGARQVTSRWILFVDADTWYQPDFVASLVHYAEAEQLDMATCFLKQVRKSPFEMILLPYAFGLYFCGVDGGAVNSARSSEALANGQCMLFRREAYEQTRGHETVLDSVIEDVALARMAKQKGLRLRILRAEHLGSVRMYSNLREIWNGFQKNSFRFLIVNPLSGVQVILASVALTSYIPMLLLLLVFDRNNEAIAFGLLPTLLLLPWYGNLITALTAPLAIYLFQLIALSGMLSVSFGLRTRWKGRLV